jgi:hypothetical protein
MELVSVSELESAWASELEWEWVLVSELELESASV